jgi:hypothetical protein
MSKNRFMLTALVLFAANCLGPSPRICAAQQGAIGGNTAGGPVTAVAPGSPPKAAFYILAEFTQSLNAKKLKPGDQIKAEVTQDVLSHGTIIIPVESKLIGHVTEVKVHRTEDPESRLGIVFDKVLLKHSREVNLQAVVQTLEAPAVRRSMVDEPSQMLPPTGGMARGLGQSTPMSAGPASTRGTIYSGPSNSDIAANPAGAPTFLPPPSSSDVSSNPHRSRPLTPVDEQKPMSVGMPLGVYGLKGLCLIPEPSSNTPGPVILSRAGDVKLERGTQILLRVTAVTAPQP